MITSIIGASKKQKRNEKQTCLPLTNHHMKESKRNIL